MFDEVNIIYDSTLPQLQWIVEIQVKSEKHNVVFESKPVARFSERVYAERFCELVLGKKAY